MSNYGQGLLSYFNHDLYDLCLVWAQITGERLQHHWSSGILIFVLNIKCVYALCLLNESDSWFETWPGRRSLWPLKAKNLFIRL